MFVLPPPSPGCVASWVQIRRTLLQRYLLLRKCPLKRSNQLNIELRVHFDKSVWKEYVDPALEHPMSTVILSIVAAFRGVKSRTLVMPARYAKPSISTSKVLTLFTVLSLQMKSVPHECPPCWV